MPGVTTLPSLPQEGEAKSRRKPSLKEQEGSEIEQKDMKDFPVVTNDTNEMDVKKDGNIKSSIKSRKGAPTKSSHGKKEIRNEEENNLDGETDSGNISPNVTSIEDDIVKKELDIAHSFSVGEAFLSFQSNTTKKAWIRPVSLLRSTKTKKTCSLHNRTNQKPRTHYPT